MKHARGSSTPRRIVLGKCDDSSSRMRRADRRTPAALPACTEATRQGMCTHLFIASQRVFITVSKVLVVMDRPDARCPMHLRSLQADCFRLSLCRSAVNPHAYVAIPRVTHTPPQPATRIPTCGSALQLLLALDDPRVGGVGRQRVLRPAGQHRQTLQLGVPGGRGWWGQGVRVKCEEPCEASGSHGGRGSQRLRSSGLVGSSLGGNRERDTGSGLMWLFVLHGHVVHVGHNNCDISSKKPASLLKRLVR